MRCILFVPIIRQRFFTVMETMSIPTRMKGIVNGVFYEGEIDGIPFESVIGLRIKQIIYQGSSKYQDIFVFDRYGISFVFRFH